MRLAFAGTPEFAAHSLDALVQAGHEIALVLTQPDRPSGRGMKLRASAVKQRALDHKIPVVQPRSLRRDGAHADDAQVAGAALLAAAPQAMVVAAYGLILPQWVLDLPERGCLNIHASLLPRWRGAAPIQRAIEAGDAQTGVSIMQMDEGLDTGDVLRMQALPILPNDTSASLHDKLAVLGSALMVRTLAGWASLVPQKQAEQGVCYAAKIDRSEAAIDWSQPAAVTERRVRAFNPYPVATARLGDEVLKVWSAQVRAQAAGEQRLSPGQVIESSSAGVLVQSGEGALLMTELQRAGARRMPLADFLRGSPIARYDLLG